MSLTLNDEQEKALRSWYEQSRRPTEPEHRVKDLRLYQAVSPLMKQWVVVTKEDENDAHIKCSGGVENELFSSIDIGITGAGAFYNVVMARRICKLLNGEEV